MMAIQERVGFMGKARMPTKPDRDEARDDRISMEIIPDAHDEEERAMSWYSYLEDTLSFPFPTRCTKERAISPLRVGDEVEVVGKAPEDECRHEIFVELPWEHRRALALPLSQLMVVHGNGATRQAVEDWHYWVGMGNEF